MKIKNYKFIALGTTAARTLSHMLTFDQLKNKINYLVFDTDENRSGINEDNFISLQEDVRDRLEEIVRRNDNGQDTETFKDYNQRFVLDAEGINNFPIATKNGSCQHKPSSLFAYLYRHKDFKNKIDEFIRMDAGSESGNHTIYIMVGIAGSAGPGMVNDLIAYLHSEDTQLNIKLIMTSPTYVCKDAQTNIDKDIIKANAVATMLLTEFVLRGKASVSFSNNRVRAGYVTPIIIDTKTTKTSGWQYSANGKVHDENYLKGLAHTVTEILLDAGREQSFFSSYVNGQQAAYNEQKFYIHAVVKQHGNAQLGKILSRLQYMEYMGHETARTILSNSFGIADVENYIKDEYIINGRHSELKIFIDTILKQNLPPANVNMTLELLKEILSSESTVWNNSRYPNNSGSNKGDILKKIKDFFFNRKANDEDYDEEIEEFSKTYESNNLNSNNAGVIKAETEKLLRHINTLLNNYKNNLEYLKKMKIKLEAGTEETNETITSEHFACFEKLDETELNRDSVPKEFKTVTGVFAAGKSPQHSSAISLAGTVQWMSSLDIHSFTFMDEYMKAYRKIKAKADLYPDKRFNNTIMRDNCSEDFHRFEKEILGKYPTDSPNDLNPGPGQNQNKPNIPPYDKTA